ncbi:MAG: dephospho-CoA kinase [Actinomycetales bacterium]|nr:dephospho-CoA kinase [Actinomycetales bacterium]
MLRVGLTGGIGSGKSTVAGILSDLGAIVTDADRVAREIVEPGEPALAAIGTEFGAAVIRADGTLDRAALAAVVFPDPGRLRALEAITGPAIAAHAARRRAAVPADRIDIYDMPLLVEKGLWVHEHLTIAVGAAEGVRLQRLIEQRGMPEADARARIAAQASDEQRREAADIWIDNGRSREQTASQVHRVWADRLVPYDENLRSGIPSGMPPRTTLSEPDPGWADAGARVVARIAAALPGRGVRVEHIGSTSVAGLLARDVIDVQVRVPLLADARADEVVTALRRAGYLPVDGHPHDPPHPPEADPRGWRVLWFAGCDPGRVVHLQVREIGSPGDRFALACRDWLRADPAARQEYAAVKRSLGERHPVTEDYTAAKAPWFAQAYPRVLTWEALR